MSEERPDQQRPPTGGPTDDPVDPVTGDAAGHPDDPGVAETPTAPGPDLDASDIEGDVEGGAGSDGGAETGGDPLQAARDQVEVLRMELAERTTDLQRIQAEFLNYKRRVDRDRELIQQNATYAALAPVTEVLDTIDRAREHGPLEDGFKTVAEQLERAVANQGLTKFGVPGDPFDPALHEALSHLGQDPDVEVTTCKVVAKAGYRMGERVLRAAQVLVVDPASPATPTE
ncbi:nucleotide exchange factor GrpE [Nocardioides pantholopis]|uniref:nucleotide exchange factor GrpE n=1 Tax=Nocardioides pantholopis TaxID=2483798 RepID=UPI001F153030|nr:nucleotide exchange factor GrpE [Nocardioides pantholopis]